MSKIQEIIKRLNEIVEMDKGVPLDELGSYIVGTLVVDDEADKLCENNVVLARIAELGGNLEISNGGDEWMAKDWQEVKQLIDKLHSNE